MTLILNKYILLKLDTHKLWSNFIYVQRYTYNMKDSTVLKLVQPIDSVLYVLTPLVVFKHTDRDELCNFSAPCNLIILNLQSK